jgi:soluble lytic murein transglycosylase-like protein
LLALLAAAAATPAAADVYERRPDGTYHLRAQDGRPDAGAVSSADAATGFDIPAQALTVVGSSRAPAAFSAAVDHFAELNHLSPALLEALVWQESRWRTEARSPKGAMGLAQLMPGTARDLGVDPRDPVANLAGGARYLRQQLDRFDGDVERALAAYNAGPGRVIRAGGIPRIAETQSYVRSVVDRVAAISPR